ncbi:hypothetical protein DJ500_28170 [Klebsiella pneumoniae]|nr:hypothetical protein DJ500_28170 [Klebsiella pneumoniae]TYE09340.1 hypothetical protein DJ510_27725 [Klebsiella pneumoniae]
MCIATASLTDFISILKNLLCLFLFLLLFFCNFFFFIISPKIPNRQFFFEQYSFFFFYCFSIFGNASHHSSYGNALLLYVKNCPNFVGLLSDMVKLPT